nr:MAG TPA: hypothetical protein [Caudoviricetes sp.]
MSEMLIKVVEVPYKPGEDENIKEIKKTTNRDKNKVDRAQKSYEDKRNKQDNDNKKDNNEKIANNVQGNLKGFILGQVVSNSIQNLKISASYSGNSEKSSQLSSALSAGQEITSDIVSIATSFAVNPILGGVNLALKVAEKALNYSTEARQLALEKVEWNLEAEKSLERISYTAGRY